MVQGPLILDFGRGRAMPGIENGELSGSNPATLRRFELWRQAGVSVEGRPEWCFIKLHCHGMIPRDDSAMLGELKSNFVQQLTELSKSTGEFQLHFVTAREMVNIVLPRVMGALGIREIFGAIDIDSLVHPGKPKLSNDPADVLSQLRG